MKYPLSPRWLVETISDRDGWKRLVVIVLHGSERWHYDVSHDANRLARSSELGRLCDEYPSIAEELAAWALP